ncbi:Endoribonuclease Dicer 1 [Grifola frondosa]|uniref:Endoribonuclease Dicer 1 n=1 Tax=Grifola frondosa TaxID=5627 RepID=A0A1C7M4Q7_GRIFR|nr:Endoribonuclease Dicer 1 [Grifola frondosa]
MLLMPSITSKIDDLLLVKQVNAKFFQHIIEEDYLLAALSPPAAWVEHDYERLELLGDAYLKDVSSIYCYVTKPTENEGALHAARQKIISNKALFSCATRIGLPSFVQGKRFVAKLWQPAVPAPEDKDTKATDMENTEESQPQASAADQDKGGAKRPKRKRQQEDQNVLWLGEKTVADVVEAIIGAAYLSGGCEVALEVSKILGVGIPDVALWSDFGRKLGTISPVALVACSVRTLAAVETIVGRSFTKVDLLVQALSHTSILKGNPAAGYDRLEFVGDAILDFLVIRHVFHRYPQMSPGGLSMLKAAMVSKYALAALCVHIGLHEHIRHASPDLEKSIRAYAENLRVQQDNEFKLAAIENRLPGQYWMELEPPKVLSDVVESVVGALYVSDDFSPAGVEAFFENVVKPFYERHVRFQTLAKHPNTTLLELLQAEGCQQHSIRKRADRQTATTQADVVVHDVVLASAVDPSTAAAIRKASILALDALEGTSDFLARTCDCRVTMPGKKSQKKQRKQPDDEPDDAMIVESLVGDGGEEESG